MATLEWKNVYIEMYLSNINYMYVSKDTPQSIGRIGRQSFLACEPDLIQPKSEAFQTRVDAKLSPNATTARPLLSKDGCLHGASHAWAR